MNNWKRNTLFSLIVIFTLAVGALLILPSAQSLAGSEKRITAQGVAMLVVPGAKISYIRFEDPEMKVVCYQARVGGEESFGFSCVKK